MSTLNRGNIMSQKENGFSMMEMIIVIGIIAILATLITPLAVNYISQKRYEVCNEELKIIKQAIIGDPTLIEGGTRSSFGFVGDLGRLPAILNDLKTQGAIPSWTTVSNVQFGWRGPYISELKDPWGNDYNYYNLIDNPLSPWPSQQGTEIVMIESFGQDGIDNPPIPPADDDDVSIIIRYDEVFSRISGNTLDVCGAGEAFSGIQVNYPNLTTVISTAALSTLADTPYYNIPTFIPIGIRYITYQPVGYPNPINKLIYINNGPITIINLRTPGICN